MAAPTITSASVTKGAFGSAATGTISSVTLSASGNDRILVISFNSKDNAGTAAIVSSITFDSAGVNRTIGSGITQQGSTQTAVEGSFATMHGLYFILEADLPASAGNYDIDIVLDSVVQYNMWTVYEITGCPQQVYDALTQSTDTADVAANTNWSASLTPTVNDCLIVDNYALSHSNSGTYSNGQTSVAEETSYLYGGSICTQFTQTTAASKTFTEQYTQLTHRRSWSIYSFSGAASGTTVNAKVDPLVVSTKAVTVNAENNVNAKTHALTLTTNTATVSLGINVNAITHALVLSNKVVTVNAENNVNTVTQALTLATKQTIVNAESNVLAKTQALTISTFTATIAAGTVIQATTQALTLLERLAIINAETNVNTVTQALSITTYAATITSTSNNVNVNAKVHALTLVNKSPTVNAANNISVTTDALIITTNVVDISTGVPPTSEGLQYTINGNRLHFTFDNEKVHYTMKA